MPELPEVETVARGLRRTVGGRIIRSVLINAPKIENDNSGGWHRKIENKRIIGIRRRGKNILIDLSDNLTLWVHLKMTGHFYFLPERVPIGRHDLLVFGIKGSRRSLRFNDYRRFGRVRLFPTDEVMKQKGLADLGPEPLEISAAEFVGLFRSSSRMVKPALLDQTFIAGLGNIYADEVLYAARIHPRQLTGRISRKKLVELHRLIQSMLKKAIRMMGTSVDTFAGINGEPGRFQKYLRVYGREGVPCLRCGTKIKREKIGSRSAHFCPRCQRLR
jgi:formamidopyrimidine-DNA glycosylase